MGNCLGSSPVNHLSTTTITTAGSTHSGENHNRVVTIGESYEEVGEIVTPNLKVFTLAELKSATKNFKPITMLGEGGFGRVFKGWLDETTLTPTKYGVGMPVAVKRSSPDSDQGIKEFKAEVDFLGKFLHPNLVRLIGYCAEEKDLLLVYEYLQKGSLESQLFSQYGEPLPWGIRISIALDAARGLHFLHTSENTVIYRDFKAANILLDENYGAKLSDFGLARMGPSNGSSHVTTQAVGTYGYAAPEYIATVLLELLTGMRAFDIKRPSAHHSLVDLYKPILHERSKLKKIIDKRMKAYPPEGAHKLARLVQKCLENDSKSRPSMAEVLIQLERIRTIMMKPKRPKAHIKRPIRASAV
ncbi:hypothetical protein V2J09_007028 [Rumex salicifolius]